jgi:hypothetical protein
MTTRTPRVRWPYGVYLMYIYILLLDFRGMTLEWNRWDKIAFRLQRYQNQASGLLVAVPRRCAADLGSDGLVVRRRLIFVTPLNIAC